MDNKQIKINEISRKIGTLMTLAGIKTVNNSINDFTDTEGDFNRFKSAMNFLNIPVSELDSKYYFTSFENWQKIMDTINPITAEINWLADRRDCDKRAMFVTAMVSFYFEINTCRPVYCYVYRVNDGQFAYAHYANIFVDDLNRVWLWDADEKGEFTRITSLNPVINNKKYVLKSIK